MQIEYREHVTFITEEKHGRKIRHLLDRYNVVEYLAQFNYGKEYTNFIQANVYEYETLKSIDAHRVVAFFRVTKFK